MATELRALDYQTGLVHATRYGINNYAFVEEFTLCGVMITDKTKYEQLKTLAQVTCMRCIGAMS